MKKCNPVFDKSGKHLGTVPGDTPFYFASKDGVVWRWDYATRSYRMPEATVFLGILSVVKIKPIK